MKSRIGSLSIIATAAVVLAFAGAVWARTFTMRSTPVTPGATGTIEAENAGGNTSLAIKVNNLASPTLLTPPANQYVVWIEPSGKTPRNAGVLTIGDGEKGELKTTTVESKFSVLVTAENEANPEKPSNRVVLRADVAL